MTDIADDLLPGDEDAILGDLERSERSSDKTQMMADAIKQMMKANPELVSGLVAPGRMPIFERDEVIPTDRFRAFHYGLQIHRPSSMLKITSC